MYAPSYSLNVYVRGSDRSKLVKLYIRRQTKRSVFGEKKKNKAKQFRSTARRKKILSCQCSQNIQIPKKENKKKKISASVDFCLSCCLKGKLKNLLIVAKKNPRK